MDFIIDTEELLKAMARVIGAVPSKSSVPALYNVLIEASSEGIVRFTAFDLSVSITSEHKAEVKDAGSIAAPAKLLGNLAKTLLNENVHIVSYEKGITVESGSANARLVGIDASDYPAIPKVNSESMASIDCKAFIGLIGKTQISMSRDDMRPVFKSLYIETPEDGVMRSTSTDGHRLTMATVSVEGGLHLDNGVVLPSKGVTELKKLMEEDTDAESSIGFDKTSAVFKRSGVTMTMLLVDGVFPNVREVIPVNLENHAVVDREVLSNALRFVCNLSGTKDATAVRFRLSEGKLKLSIESDNGVGTQEIPADYHGDSIEVGINPLYVKDVLSVMDGPEVNLAISEETTPVVVTETDSDGFIAIIMPVRL